ncbi:HTH-type transcriptional regulator XynR [Anaerolineales bacterium]|nr:HTH-type transcriptional regulator XynR [Anaerolineales bacterium]
MKDPSEYNVRAVERALQILECFDNEHAERGISEIAQAVELHKATAHRIVTTLVNYGYLERAEDGQKYRLGLELTNLGFKVIHRMDLRREAIPYMKQLVEQWDETCDLSVFDRGSILYIEVVRGSRALTVAAAVGQRLPIHCTASGKLFLTHLPPEEQNSILSKPLASYTASTVTSPDEIRKEMEVIRNQGYAIDKEGFEVGVCAVAAPIYNRRGNVIAVIGSPSPTSRMTPERTGEMAKSFKEAAQAISHRMGYDK